MPGGYVFPQDDDPNSPWPVFERVLSFPELELQAGLVVDHEVRFAFAFRYDDSETGWIKGQKMVLGTACMPTVNGSLRDLFDQLLEDTLGYRPDFLITLNGSWWEQATEREREVLVFHEVKHCGQAVDRYGVPKFTRQDNSPVLQMINHDIEEFHDVARRYGAWKSDLVSFEEALREGLLRDQESRVADFAGAMRDLAAKGITVTLHPVTDGDLPPNVSNVDPDLVADRELGRGGLSQDESPDDVF